MTLKIFKLQPKEKKDFLLSRVLQSNYSRALNKVITSVMELQTLTCDAPLLLPVDDKEKLLNFSKSVIEQANKLM